MPDDEDFARLISEYQLTYGNELQAKLNRLDGIIGDRHWLSVGAYKENLVKGVLRNRLPRKYEVGTGFVLTCRGKNRVISRQIDILIWDSEDHSPLFRDGEFVVVPPEACLAAIEVKSTLSAKDLRESLLNLDSLMHFYPDHYHLREKVLHRSVFAFSLGGDIQFPSGIFNALHASYQRSTILPLQERVKFSKEDLERWQLPWISSISVLGAGNVHCDLWALNKTPHVVHTAYRAESKTDAMDAYGFLERTLLMDLLLNYQRHVASQTRPGLMSLLYANSATPTSGKWYMPVPPMQIAQVGNFQGEENDEWIKNAYSPRKPRKLSKGAGSHSKKKP